MTDGTNMNIHDRLAEKLKSDEFGKWFGEEDLHDLIKVAVDKAFFKDRSKFDGYRTLSEPPLIVTYAEKYVAEQIERLAREAMAERLAADPTILDSALAKAFEGGIEELMVRALKAVVINHMIGMEHAITERLRTMVLR